LEGLATTKTSLHHNRVNAFLHGAMQWFKKFEDERRLNASPVMIAASLHQMAEKDDPQVTPEALCLPEAVHAGFREKLFLFREANVLLALMDRVSPSSDVRDPLFELVFGEYERIIFRELSDHFGELSDHPILRAARRQSVMAALQDLYQSSNWVTDNCPVATRDRHDFPGLVNQRVPGRAAVVDDVVEGFEDAV